MEGKGKRETVKGGERVKEAVDHTGDDLTISPEVPEVGLGRIVPPLLTASSDTQ